MSAREVAHDANIFLLSPVILCGEGFIAKGRLSETSN